MYFICGRLKEIIIRNGENISPIAVENELLNLSPKFEMAVIGFNNNYVGEEVGLYINVGRHKLDKAQILNMLDQVTEFQRPRCILLGKTAIPRTSTGKIQRKKLTYLFDNHKDKLLNSRNPMIIELE
ncbi:putative sulfoacetate--CoA ligase [compost metagenome]